MHFIGSLLANIFVVGVSVAFLQLWIKRHEEEYSGWFLFLAVFPAICLALGSSGVVNILADAFLAYYFIKSWFPIKDVNRAGWVLGAGIVAGLGLVLSALSLV